MDNTNSETKHSTIDHVRTIIDTLDGITLYEHSIHEYKDALFFIIRNGFKKQLVIEPGNALALFETFNGEERNAGNYKLMVCELTHENAEALRSIFPFTNASLIGKVDSYGFGDRLGMPGRPICVQFVKQGLNRYLPNSQSGSWKERKGRPMKLWTRPHGRFFRRDITMVLERTETI
jgi:hypothetical protein